MYPALAEAAVHVPMQWIAGPEPPTATADPKAPYLIGDIIPDYVKDKASFLENAKLLLNKYSGLQKEQLHSTSLFCGPSIFKGIRKNWRLEIYQNSANSHNFIEMALILNWCCLESYSFLVF